MKFLALNIKYLRLKKQLKQSELADVLGVTRENITSYEKETAPKLDFIEKFVNYFSISVDDLLYKDLSKELEAEEELDFNDLVSKKNSKPIPLIPIEAVAGIGSEGFYSIKLSEVEEKYYIPLFDKKGIDFVSPVRGDSMWPMYSSGDVVGCKFVNSILFFQWGQVYFLDTVSQGPLLKQVFKAPNSNSIICHSINTVPYPDFEVPLSDIRSLSLVMGSVRLQ